MQADGGVAGHVIVVTGASSGLGEQLARSLVQHGARPVLPPAAPSAWPRCARSSTVPWTR